MVVIQWDLMGQGCISAYAGVCAIRKISFHEVLAERYCTWAYMQPGEKKMKNLQGLVTQKLRQIKA